MSQTAHLHLFEGFGIELELMIVDKTSLAVRPISDKVLTAEAGSQVNEVERGRMAWSNELVMHVIELKTNGPDALKGLDQRFLGEVKRINELLAPHDARLLPTAMHPFFDPGTETKLWMHDDNEVYEAYDRIFGCKGHGWSNLQSIHINLPFFDDDEFGKLHAAVRLVLPLLPALAASSPLHGGKPSGIMDSRLEFYRLNQKAVPSITGAVIPEQAFTQKEYEEKIFQKIYRDIAPHDPQGILQFEWLNSRGAIARWDRHAIEIRVLDIQESPRMDLGVIATVVSLVQALVDERYGSLKTQKLWPEEPLRNVFLECLKFGGEAPVMNQEYLDTLGIKAKAPLKAQEVWTRLVDDLLSAGTYPVKEYAREAQALVKHGCLASRILKAIGPEASADAIRRTYARLAEVLAEGKSFDAPL